MRGRGAAAGQPGARMAIVLPATQVPAAVLEKYKALYPAGTVQTWRARPAQADSIYLADFVVEGQRHRAKFRKDGDLIGIHRFHRAAATLPAPVMEAAMAAHAGYRFSWAREWVPQGGTPKHYVVHLRKRGATARVVLNEEGKPVGDAEVPAESTTDAE